MSDIVVAVITGGISALVSIFRIIMANRKSSAILQYKVDELDRHVKQHNNLIDRMYGAEDKINLHDQRLKSLEDRKKGKLRYGNENRKRPGGVRDCSAWAAVLVCDVRVHQRPKRSILYKKKQYPKLLHGLRLSEAVRTARPRLYRNREGIPLVGYVRPRSPSTRRTVSRTRARTVCTPTARRSPRTCRRCRMSPASSFLCQGHVGVYIGNGKVVEARGHAYGVVRTNLKSRPWSKWAYDPDLVYDTETGYDADLG